MKSLAEVMNDEQMYDKCVKESQQHLSEMKL